MQYPRAMLHLFLLISVLLWSTASSSAEPPVSLHARIDQAINAAHVGPKAEIASDYEFLRRLYLDFVGRTPTAQELRAFVADTAAGKRGTVVDQLLNSAEFDAYFVRVLDVMLMERRSDKRVDQQAWLQFLSKALEEHWTFDEIVRRIISADGTEGDRGAAKFLLARDVEPNALTRDVGRLLLGRDLQCAQCHDHPNIMDYEQSEYYGIYAFLNRSYLFEDASDNKKSYVGEKADGETEFKSVFLPEDGTTRTIPQLLNGLVLDVEPRIADSPYLVEPTKNEAAVPRYSRRDQLARLTTHPQNRWFAKNMVNRLWAHLFGRGFVHPVDFHHSDNPPTHPHLLEWLADEWIAMEFDVRELLKQMALSDAYQRSIDLPKLNPQVVGDALSVMQQNETQWQRELEATAASDLDSSDYEQQLTQRRQLLTQKDQEIQQTIEQRDALQTQRNELQKNGDDAREKMVQEKSRLRVVQAAAEAAKKANEALPEDEALAHAAKELQGRLTALQETLASHEEAVAENKAKTDSLTTSLRDAERRLAELQSDRLGLADIVAEARGALSVFKARQRKHEARRNELAQRRTAMKPIQNYFILWNESRSAKEKATRCSHQRQTAKQEIDRLEDAVSEVQNGKRHAKDALDELQDELTTLEVDQKNDADLLSGLDLVIANLKDEGSDAAGTALTVLNARHSKQVAEHSARQATISRKREDARQLHLKIESCSAAETQLRSDLQQARNLQTQAGESLREATERMASVSLKLESAEKSYRAACETRFAVRALSGLSPEQLAGATISALGLDARFRQEAEREWQHQQSKKEEQPADSAPKPSEPQQREDEIEALYQKRVARVFDTYVAMFGAPAGAPQDVFSATADQALFLSNDGRFQNWLSPAADTLLKRLTTSDDPAQIADELYLAILSRPPSVDETLALEAYLADRPDNRTKALQEIAWGLLSSLEFRFNH